MPPADFKNLVSLLRKMLKSLLQKCKIDEMHMHILQERELESI